jgi:hypothetical protein
MADTTTTPAVKPATDTGNKINAALRYLGSNATGGLTVFVILGFLTPEQQVEILKSAHQMYDATYSFVGAAANIWYIVAPAAAIYLAKIGIDSSGFVSMMNRIFAAAKAGNLEAKVAIVNAAASPAIGTQAIVNPELAPLAATSTNVVSTPAAVPASLPQNPAPAMAS